LYDHSRLKEHVTSPGASGYSEDRGLKPAQANSSRDAQKKIIKKRVGGVAQGVGPEFKHQYWKKKRVC
jgi:hypothetical protein